MILNTRTWILDDVHTFDFLHQKLLLHIGKSAK
jgi:hypothetical protein